MPDAINLTQCRRAGGVTSGSGSRNAALSSNVVRLDPPEGVAETRYDRALARQEAHLREVVGKVQVPRDEYDAERQQSGTILSALFAARETAAQCLTTLTPREREVLELVLAGHPSKIIAWKLNISQRTVENHRASIMKKTASKSLPALARLAVSAAWNGVDGSFVLHLARAAPDA
jgi:DNA-binding CsgD family transcriptional regulator